MTQAMHLVCARLQRAGRSVFGFLAIMLAVPACAQLQGGLSPYHAGAGSIQLSDVSNLPVQRIGRDDLVGIAVYDAPELTRTVRVGAEGDIRLPMLRGRVKAAGLYPAELEAAITAALTDENVLVDPIVTVSVVEYRSRPISVVGAVKNPVTFQATGKVTLLDAISQAQGLTENAGAEILISRPVPDAEGNITNLTQRIPVRDLLSAADPSLNIPLQGWEEIRVPEAGRVFVLGNVKKPGAFLITDGSESSVMKAIALSEGLGDFSGHKAYIYRTEGGAGSRSEIPIELKKIMNRSTPDVPLRANDILYIPDAAGFKASVKVLAASVGAGAAISSALIYSAR
jgi:polysaccharide export outer membrane protein